MTPSQTDHPYIRQEVMEFAIAMETKLRAKDHLGLWSHNKSIGNIDWAFDRMKDEVEELREAIYEKQSNGEISGEAVDVGNFAMMTFDISRELSKKEKEKING